MANQRNGHNSVVVAKTLDLTKAENEITPPKFIANGEPSARGVSFSSECEQPNVSAGRSKWPARQRSTRDWVSSRDRDVRKTVGLEVELKRNLPSFCEETNQAAGLAIGGVGGSLPVQRAGRHSRVVEEEKQTVSERPPWESLW